MICQFKKNFNLQNENNDLQYRPQDQKSVYETKEEEISMFMPITNDYFFSSAGAGAAAAANSFHFSRFDLTESALT